jgi:hypothetical protein
MGIRIGVGAAVIAVAATAGCGGGSDSGWGTVIGANQRPVIQHLRIEHDDPEAPGLVRAVAEVRDPDGDEVEIRYAWEVAGVAQPESGAELSLSRARKGTRVTVTAIAQDSRAQSEPAVRVVHLRNLRPEPATDAWRNARPSEGLDVAFTGERRFEAQLRVAPDGGAFENGSSVTELEVGAEGEALRYAVEVPRTDGASRIRFRLLLGPEGMWVHPASGEVTWLPESWQIGTYPVEVEVTDASGAVTVEAFSVNAGIDEPEPALPAKLAIP